GPDQAVALALRIEKLRSGEPLVETELLGEESHPGSRSWVRGWSAEELDRTRGRAGEPEHHLDDGRFSRPIGAQQSEDLASGDIQVEHVNCYPGAEDLAQPPSRDGDG